MSLFSQIFPSLNALEILGDTDAFTAWMHKKHSDKSMDEIFEGYKFSIECCLMAFLDGIECDTSLGIKSDFRLNRAMNNSISLHQLENSCEKTIFLKNINPFVKNILRAELWDVVVKEVEKFQNNILYRFIEIDNLCSNTKKKVKVDISVAKKLRLIDFVQTFLVQMGNFTPIAYFTHLSYYERLSKERRDRCFEGYKYAIQFLLFEILGEGKFNETSLIHMHKADSWYDFKYIDDGESDDTLSSLLNRRFNLEEQTCFDSYFWRITDEITSPLQEEYGFEIHRIDSYFNFNNANYNKNRHFSDLLNSEELTYQPNFSNGEGMLHKLYWYSIDITHDFHSPMLSPTISLCTKIAGSIELYNSKNSEIEGVFVVKFTHPRGDERNDYSYGILIDSSRSLYSSGWAIYYDICNNFTGAASEYNRIESLILNKKDRINLIEITISHSEFRDFINKQNQKEDIESESSNSKQIKHDSDLLKEIREIKSMIGEQGERQTIQNEYLLEHIIKNEKLLKAIKEQTYPAKIEEVVQALLARQSQQDAENIMAFLNTAIQVQHVRNMAQFEDVKKEIEKLNKPSSPLEAKIKIGLPLAALLGLDISFEGKVDLKKVMKTIVQKKEEFADKCNINY